jgi:addiction module RelE/StbE family toxin
VVRRIEWAERALKDLREIYDFIAKDSSRYAQIQVANIQDAVSNLLVFPMMGRQVPEFPHLPYREIFSGNYRIIYKYNKKEEEIYVMAVVHGHRLLTNVMQ